VSGSERNLPEASYRLREAKQKKKATNNHLLVALLRTAGKAVSRFLFLNPPFICATYPLASDGQPSSASIFGLAGPGTVPMQRRRRMS